MVKSLELSLEDLLRPDSPSLTDALGERSYEAIMMCFEHHGHESSLYAKVSDLDRETLANLEIAWIGQNSKSDCARKSRIRRSFGAARNAAETAAEGFAQLLIPEMTGFVLLERSNIGSGVDYWLTRKKDMKEYDFANREARLEVSGTVSQEHLSGVENIVRKNLEQTKSSDYSGLPAHVIVVEFGRPIIYVEAR